ncbi:unnamed protein product [Pleuronectes platessa]|uniref:Uncharacterized protein n=1 Tax=Pleuronectes platessa TaxID=8262 RepID=A0A9N7UM56_PLEPL|nr:unnamed protein product [Pleuronectes platessa]
MREEMLDQGRIIIRKKKYGGSTFSQALSTTLVCVFVSVCVPLSTSSQLAPPAGWITEPDDTCQRSACVEKAT